MRHCADSQSDSHMASAGTLSVTLYEVADVVLVEIFIKGGSQELLGQVG